MNHPATSPTKGETTEKPLSRYAKAKRRRKRAYKARVALRKHVSGPAIIDDEDGPSAGNYWD